MSCNQRVRSSKSTQDPLRLATLWLGETPQVCAQECPLIKVGCIHPINWFSGPHLQMSQDGSVSGMWRAFLTSPLFSQLVWAELLMHGGTNWSCIPKNWIQEQVFIFTRSVKRDSERTVTDAGGGTLRGWRMLLWFLNRWLIARL